MLRLLAVLGVQGALRRVLPADLTARLRRAVYQHVAPAEVLVNRSNRGAHRVILAGIGGISAHRAARLACDL